MITDKDYDEAHKQQMDYEKEIDDHNNSLFESSGVSVEDMEDLLSDCTITSKAKIVKEPRGQYQDEEYGTIDSVFVDQYSRGDGGDSYEGTIYAQLGKDKWIAVSYQC